MLYLLAAVVVGGLVLANQGIGFSSRVGALLPVFYHLLTVGWLTQLIGGVALWLFPPLSRERPRGDERLAWAAYGALNAGLLLRVFAEPLHTWQPAPASGYALVMSALLQAAGVWALVLALWPRVKGKPSRAGG